jgi:hypothetical protein
MTQVSSQTGREPEPPVLHDERYRELVVEVDNPEAAVKLIESAM